MAIQQSISLSAKYLLSFQYLHKFQKHCTPQFIKSHHLSLSRLYFLFKFTQIGSQAQEQIIKKMCRIVYSISLYIGSSIQGFRKVPGRVDVLYFEWNEISIFNLHRYNIFYGFMRDYNLPIMKKNVNGSNFMFLIASPTLRRITETVHFPCMEGSTNVWKVHFPQK